MSRHSGKKELDQADELRRVFNEVENHENKEEAAAREEMEIDVLNLPPRKEVHAKSGRTKLRVSRPFIRFALIVAIVLLCLIAALYALDGNLPALMEQL